MIQESKVDSRERSYIRTRRWAGASLPPAGIALAVVMLTLCGSGCKRDTESESKDSPKAAASIDGRGMNVLLVSVDTTRADHIGCYGHPVVKTPNIDRFAAQGTRFAQCIASAPLTLPSHCTIMTGSYQYVHGVRYNAGFELSEENTTLAELFKDAGYATAAEVAVTVLDSKLGMAQGFDHYGNVEIHAPSADDPDGVKDLFLGENLERAADDINACGIELLEKHKDHPFFMFLHYFDPHKDYRAPARFAEQYRDGYLAEIAFFDEQFGVLMDKLQDLGLAEKTLVILLSDHGEGLGQHNEETHSFFVYDTTQHVPLIMRLPGKVPAGAVVSSQVRLIDLASTIVDFAGLEQTPQMQGATLLPLLADPNLDVDLPCYADSIAGKLVFGYSPLRFLRADGWKYIHAPKPELYHVSEDPGELANLFAKEPQRAVEMREELRRIIAESPPPPGSRGALVSSDDDDFADLAGLGYVGGVSDADMAGSEIDDFEPTGPDPKDRLQQIRLVTGAMGARAAGNLEAAEVLSRKLIELEPNASSVVLELAKLLAAQQRLDEAAGLYRRALEIEPRDTKARALLARTLAVSGDHAESEKQFRKILEIDENNANAHSGLAAVLSEQKRYDEAYEEYAAAAEAAPESAEVRFKWGMAYKMAGRLEEAAAKLEEATDIAPEFVEARAYLTQTLQDLARIDEAIEGLVRVVAERPDDTEYRRLLAATYTKVGNHAAAIEQLRRILELHPDAPEAHFNLGLALLTAEKPDESLPHLRKALSLEPEYGRALVALAQALEATGESEEAIVAYEKAMEVNPEDASVYDGYAVLLDSLGQQEKALAVLSTGHERIPGATAILNNLAWCLATSKNAKLRDGARAVEFAERLAAAIGDENAATQDTLAAAYAEAGRFDEAVKTAERAIEIAKLNGREELAVRVAARLDLYKKRRPYHEP